MDIVLSHQGDHDGDTTPTETAMPLLTLDITSSPLTVVNLCENPDRSAWSVGGRPLSEGEW